MKEERTREGYIIQRRYLPQTNIARVEGREEPREGREKIRLYTCSDANLKHDFDMNSFTQTIHFE